MSPLPWLQEPPDRTAQADLARVIPALSRKSWRWWAADRCGASLWNRPSEGLKRHLESREWTSSAGKPTYHEHTHTRACIQNRPDYYGTANEAAVSPFKVTLPGGESRNYYFVIFKGKSAKPMSLALGSTKAPKKWVNGSLFTSGIGFHSWIGRDREST